jgi:hypothetical protein
MTLQSSGFISLANVQTEFGGANPISLSEYYSGGPYVGSWVSGVPSSGAVSLSNFYGKQSYITPVSGTSYFYINGSLVLTQSSGATATGLSGGVLDTDNGQSNVQSYAAVIAAGTLSYTLTTNNLNGTFRATIGARNSSGASTDDGFVAIGQYRSSSLVSGQYFGWSPSYAGANVSVSSSWNYALLPGDQLQFWVASAAGGSANHSSGSHTAFEFGEVVGP